MINIPNYQPPSSNNKKYLIAFSVLLILLFTSVLIWFYTNSMRKERQNLINQLNGYKITEKVFLQKRLADSTLIATQTQTALSQKEALQLGLIKLQDDMKKLQAQISSTTMTHFDRFDVEYIPYGYADTTNGKLIDTTGLNLIAKHNFTAADTGTIKVPMLFAKKEKWYEIGGYVGKNKLVVDSLKVFNADTISIGEKLKNNNFFYKINPFKKLEPVVTIKHGNPYTSTQQMGNVIIHEPKPITTKFTNTIKNAALVYAVVKFISLFIK